jgi:hypothetical protein
MVGTRVIVERVVEKSMAGIVYLIDADAHKLH